MRVETRYIGDDNQAYDTAEKAARADAKMKLYWVIYKSLNHNLFNAHHLGHEPACTRSEMAKFITDNLDHIATVVSDANKYLDETSAPVETII
jgi:Mg2+ and Co2+ transporter CorA